MENLWNPKKPLNRRSDIVCVIQFWDENKSDWIAVPSVPWSIRFFTDDRHESVTTHKGGKIINGKIDEGKLFCSIPANTLATGTLYIEKKFSVPDASFPDRTRDYVNVIETEYELVNNTEEDTLEEPFYAFDIDMKLYTESGKLLTTEDGKEIDLNIFE